MRKIIILVVISFVFSSFSLQAQHCDHHHVRNEIGVSGGAIYSFDHKEWGLGTHIHYYRTLGDHSKWSLGAMFEYAWTHGDHFTLGAGVKYQVFPLFSVAVLPGVTFLNHEKHEHHDSHGHNEKETRFSTHIELVYDVFHWKKFHLGPVVDVSLSKNDSHGMIGAHFAYCF